MYVMRLLLLVVCALVVWSSCTQDDEDPKGAGGVYDVDPIFEPYVQQFIKEGAQRGLAIDFSDTGLKMELSDRQLEFAGGFCYLGQHHVVINKSVWQEGFEDYKTRLIFHELGHCELDRRHRNDRFSNSVWKSLMRGDPLNQAERQIPVPFFGFRKQYYIDELFNEQIGDPEWANVDFVIDDVSPDQKSVEVSEDSLSRFFQSLENPLEQYEIIVDFTLNKTAAQSTTLTWTTDAYQYSITFYAENLYTIDASVKGTDLFLYRATNSANIGGREVDRITVQRHDGYEKIFLNDQFIFHIDPMPGPLKSLRFESKEFQTGVLQLDFDIKSVEVYRIN